MAMTRALNVTAAQAAAFRLQRQHLHGDRPAKAFALHRNGGHVRGDRSDLPVGRSAPAGRSAKALAERSVVDIVRDSAGVQAQVQSSAEIAIWTRRRETTREEIRGALWDTRDLVKTSAMRLTLHLIPARDLAVYINAMRPSSSAALARWQARLKISPAHVRMMIDTVLDSLSDGALTQQELIARAKQRAHKGMRAWLDHAWSAVRPAVIEGAIVYGPSRGAEATFVRVDKWLGTQPQLTVDEARAELLRRFLRAFGPATAHDFAKWSGIKVSDARVVVGALDRELAAVSVDGAPGWIASADVDTLRGSELDEDSVRLLGPFDSFLLAHATKEHVVDAAFYKRVYRPQGWISAVVLRGGTAVGVWRQKAEGKTIAIEVDLFRPQPPAVRKAIAADADAMSAFSGARCVARFG